MTKFQEWWEEAGRAQAVAILQQEQHQRQEGTRPMTDLKPCPHCNSPAELNPVVLGYCRCPNCDDLFWEIELWNTRPIEDALRAEIKRLKLHLSQQAHYTSHRAEQENDGP